MPDISNADDIIDVRAIIERVEELEDIVPNSEAEDAGEYQEEHEELATLTSLLDDLRDVGGGDHQWKGDWYPVTLIRESYFKDYAQELAEDIGAIPADAGWPARCIDWDQAARELRMDYTSVEFDGVTYWTR